MAAVMMMVVIVMVVGCSALFHHMMALEGREYSWATAVYWTLVTMSTLGYGDVVFESDAGRVFSSVVLVTGAAFILVLLPFVFIQFVFRPWLNSREAARAPRRVGDWAEEHIVLTGLDAVTDSIIELAEYEGAPYVLIVPDLAEALRLREDGYQVMLGDLDDPQTYRRARAEKASLVVTTQPDTTNANVAFTVREIAPEVPMVATANASASVPVLQLAGCTEVVQLGDALGRALARRVVGVDSRAHVIGEFGDLRIAEANVSGTIMAGRTLAETDLDARAGVNVIGVREKGTFAVATPHVRLTSRMVLLLVGTDEQIAGYDGGSADGAVLDRPVLVIGGGRVGRAAAAALEEAGLRPVIVEKRAERILSGRAYVEGDAAVLEVLERAGLDKAAAALVTTHEDDVNVYLTLYLRRLRPDLQVVARATRERNVSTLHRAGADAVLSYASIGAAAIWNTLGWRPRLVIAEGVDVFRTPMPRALRGRSLREVQIAKRTGCQVVALNRNGQFELPDHDAALPSDAELLVIGDEAAEQRFVERYAGRR
ncbi:potassium channel family protein [Dietzia lutea]|nr:NAD-binding protein [Dietzia lutea]